MFESVDSFLSYFCYIIFYTFDLALMGFSVFGLVYSLRKRKLKKKWEQNRTEAAMEGMLPPNANHKPDLSETISKTMVVLLSCFAVLSLVFYTWLQTKEKLLQIDALDSSIEELQEQLSDIQIAQKKVSSRIYSVTFTPLQENFDSETMTADFLISVIPKQTGENTQLVLQIDGEEIPLEKNDYRFETVYRRNLMQKLHTACVTVTENGTPPVTETLDEELFPALSFFLKTAWTAYIPSVQHNYSDIEKTGLLGLKERLFSLWFYIKMPTASDVSLASCEMCVEISDTTVATFNLLPLLIWEESGSTAFFQYDRCQAENDALSDFLADALDTDKTARLFITITDSIGNTVKSSFLGYNGSEHDFYHYNMNTVFDAAGTLTYKSTGTVYLE